MKRADRNRLPFSIAIRIGPLAFVAFGLTPAVVGSPEDWPQFRGPGGTGYSESATPPSTWSATENVDWVVEIPGRGWSSPIVWGKRIFLTSAISVGGTFKEPSTGIFGNDFAAELSSQGLSDEEVMDRVVSRDIELSRETESIRYMVYALDAESGKTLWERESHAGKPFGGRHRKNTYASETPATDGERLYAYFGNVGVYAYSLEGDLVWEHHFPTRSVYLDFGTAASPAVDGEHVYVQFDNQDESFLAALDKRTGKEKWKVVRGQGNESMIRSGWSSPFVWATKTRREVVAIGHGSAVGYAADDGWELWRLSGLSGQATPTPIPGDGVLYIGTGSQGESNRPMFAVREGASGDISLAEGATSNEFVSWKNPQASAYTSSPLLYRGRLYVVNDNGIASAFDPGTGERLYRARVGGGGFTFSASPWAYDGKVFFLGEDGDAFVVREGARYEELSKNSLGEMTFASPAISGDSLYIRTQTKLYRIREKR